MYGFLILWDSSVAEQEERLIEVALKEAIEVFPGCTFIAVRPDSKEMPISVADSIVLSASIEKNLVSASDIAKTIEDIRKDILGISAEVYVIFVTAIDIAPDQNTAPAKIVVQSFNDYKNLALEDEMYCFLHSFCSTIGALLGLSSARICENDKCVMHSAKNTEELLEQARLEDHGELRICEKCKKTLYRLMPLAFCEYSSYEII